MVLETVEADTMGVRLLTEFHAAVRERLDPRLPLLFKPANHIQEAALDSVPVWELPRITAHELYGTADFTALNPGEAYGRLRYFAHADDYREAQERGDIAWYDILAMHVVPDDIPQVAAISSAPAPPLRCPTRTSSPRAGESPTRSSGTSRSALPRPTALSTIPGSATS